MRPRAPQGRCIRHLGHARALPVTRLGRVGMAPQHRLRKAGAGQAGGLFRLPRGCTGGIAPRLRRMGGRAVEGARLESAYTPKAYRGFESHPIRRDLWFLQGLRLLRSRSPQDSPQDAAWLAAMFRPRQGAIRPHGGGFDHVITSRTGAPGGSGRHVRHRPPAPNPVPSLRGARGAHPCRDRQHAHQAPGDDGHSSSGQAGGRCDAERRSPARCWRCSASGSSTGTAPAASVTRAAARTVRSWARSGSGSASAAAPVSADAASRSASVAGVSPPHIKHLIHLNWHLGFSPAPPKGRTRPSRHQIPRIAPRLAVNLGPVRKSPDMSMLDQDIRDPPRRGCVAYRVQPAPIVRRQVQARLGALHPPAQQPVGQSQVRVDGACTGKAQHLRAVVLGQGYAASQVLGVHLRRVRVREQRQHGG